MTKKTRRAKARRALLTLSLVLVSMMVAVGGTIAYLTDDTDKIVNTFTVGNINISIAETNAKDDDKDGVWEQSFKLIPGTTYAKDPSVTVEAGSEACWLFVKVTDNGASDYVTYAVDTAWSRYGTTDVYYREVEATLDDEGKPTEDATFYILAGDNDNVNGKVTVKDLDKATMDALEKAGTLPTLTFKAAAVQKDNVDTVEDAYDEVSALLAD